MTTPATPHTPTPWAATTRQGSWDWVVYSVADPNIEICQPFHDGTDENSIGEANAALIVHCVNTHAQLVAALDEAERVLGAMHKDGWKVGGDVLTTIRAAISAGKGGGK